MSEVNLPDNDYKSRQSNAVGRLEGAMSGFKDLIKDKLHPENQSKAYKDNVSSILTHLLSEANELDMNSPGKGFFSLIVLCLRTDLELKDMIIKQDVRIKDLERDIRRLKGRVSGK